MYAWKNWKKKKNIRESQRHRRRRRRRRHQQNHRHARIKNHPHEFREKFPLSSQGLRYSTSSGGVGASSRYWPLAAAVALAARVEGDRPPPPRTSWCAARASLGSRRAIVSEYTNPRELPAGVSIARALERGASRTSSHQPPISGTLKIFRDSCWIIIGSLLSLDWSCVIYR